jgi:hypothetical protein
MNTKTKHSIVTKDASVKTVQSSSRKMIRLRILLLISMLMICFACTKNGEDIVNEEDVIDGVKCSELGMIPNDETQGTNNRKILINALNDGINILIDNKYYLTGLGTPAIIDSDIVIAGVTDNAEFSFTKTTMTGSNFLKIESQNFLMRKVKLTSIQNEYVYAFRFSDTHKMKDFSVEKCYFEGSVRLMNWAFTNNVYPNPDEYDYGIENFKFAGNTCNNISTTFIAIANVPTKHSQITGNEVRNFKNIFYNQEITNVNIHVDKLAPKISFLEVKDNTVINDISWDGKEQGRNHMYHCFIFFEGDKCEYKNNHIEGLHIFDEDINVYDAYLSCINLEYENNFWKNNIVFNSDPGFDSKGRQMMKCKDSPRLDGYKNIKRVCRNNTFIVEKSYADNWGRPYDELWVKIIEFDNDMETVVVDNNKIDVYILRLNTADVKTHNFTFINNDIHAVKTRNSSSNCVLPVTAKIDDGIHGTYIARKNKIVIDEPGSSPGTNNSLIRYTFPNGNIDHTKVIFEDNYVKWPDMSTIIRSAYTITIGNVPIDISITNNTVITETEPIQISGIRGATIDLSSNTFIATSGSGQ